MGKPSTEQVVVLIVFQYRPSNWRDCKTLQWNISCITGSWSSFSQEHSIILLTSPKSGTAFPWSQHLIFYLDLLISPDVLIFGHWSIFIWTFSITSTTFYISSATFCITSATFYINLATFSITSTTFNITSAIFYINSSIFSITFTTVCTPQTFKLLPDKPWSSFFYLTIFLINWIYFPNCKYFFRLEQKIWLSFATATNKQRTLNPDTQCENEPKLCLFTVHCVVDWSTGKTTRVSSMSNSDLHCDAESWRLQSEEWRV